MIKTGTRLSISQSMLEPSDCRLSLLVDYWLCYLFITSLPVLLYSGRNVHFLSEGDLSQLASRSRVFKSASRLTTI